LTDRVIIISLFVGNKLIFRTTRSCNDDRKRVLEDQVYNVMETIIVKKTSLYLRTISADCRPSSRHHRL